MTPAEHVALTRKKKGITQEALAEVSGISLRTIQRIELGQTNARSHTLKILAEHLGIDLTDLIDDKVSQSEVTNSHSFIAVQRMNATGLTALCLPFLPLLFTWLIWRKHSQEPLTHMAGKRIMSFQVIWIILTFFIMVSIKIIYYYVTGFHAIGHLSPLLPTYLIMVAIHLFVVLYSAVRIQNQEMGIYRFVPLLF